MKRSTKGWLGVVGGFAIVACGSLAPATAAESEYEALTPDMVAEFTVAFDELGIDAATQESLLEIVDDGGELDSWRGGSAVESTSWQEGDFHYTLDVYEDGSRALTTVQWADASIVDDQGSSDGEVSEMSASACRTVANQVFNGCWISRTTGGLTMNYTINGHTRASGGSNAAITGHSPTYCSFAGGTVQNTDWYMGNAVGTTAWGLGSCRVDLIGGGGTATYGLEVRVTSSVTAIER